MISRAVLLSIAALALPACEGADEAVGPNIDDVDRAPLAASLSEWPSAEDPGNPYYARIEPVPPHIYSDGAWAVFVFYRDPGCIRPDFDLLEFFDPPAAFGCASMVSGRSIWEEAIGVGAPRQVIIEGNGAVPVWLAPAVTAADAVGDGTLTIGELEGLPGLVKGTATRFNEVLMPHPLPPFLGGGGHPNPKLTLVARGALEDGRSFQYSLNRGDYDELHTSRLTIR
ncbi:MAG: hypothetical protein ACODAB_08330 [Gemmatimonadota bacterium]